MARGMRVARRKGTNGREPRERRAQKSAALTQALPRPAPPRARDDARNRCDALVAMFYSVSLLSQKGPLALVWLVAHSAKKTGRCVPR